MSIKLLSYTILNIDNTRHFQFIVITCAYREITPFSPSSPDRFFMNNANVEKTDNLQFGFKQHPSTVICTALLIETIEYYRENGSDCYLLLLAASKAFDRVEYVKLFNTLRCGH